jgi:hypothetical protein
MSRKIKGIKIDVRSKDCLYITIGKWVIYIDNSTGEEIICWNSPGNKKTNVHHLEYRGRSNAGPA